MDLLSSSSAIKIIFMGFGDHMHMAKDMRLNRIGVVVLCTIGIFVLVVLLYRSGGGYDDETIKISELLSAAIYLAEAGGKRVVEVRAMDNAKIGQLAKGVTREGASEYVTYGDSKSHEIIVSGLKAGWPNLPYRSEETDRPLVDVSLPPRFNSEVMAFAKRDEEVPMKAVTVWIDPLDATQEYTEGDEDPELLQYVTVMLCIAVKGEPIAGVIHQPYDNNGKPTSHGVTKWAWVGHGVSRSLQGAVSSKKADHNIRVIASRSHAGKVYSIAKEAFGEGVKLISAAGAGYKSLAVVEKNADLYLHTTAIKKWDICAGNAILSATGGKMTTRKGERIDYSLKGDPKNSDGLVVATTEHEHAEYLEKLKI